MSITLPMLIVLIVIAAVCGAIGKAIAGGRGGFLISTVLGFVGAVVGPWIAAQLHLREPLVLRVDGHPFPITWSIIGAAVVVAALHLLTRGRRRFRFGH